MDENSNLDKINGLLKGMLVDLVDEQSRSRKLSENWNQLEALKQGSRNWPNPVFVEPKLKIKLVLWDSSQTTI